METQKNTIKIKLEESKLLEVIKSGALNFYDYEVVSNEPAEYNYKDNDQWQEAKKEANKAFKNLKKVEFNIRHNSDESKKLINIIK